MRHIDGVLKEVVPELDLESIKPVRSRRSKEANGHDGSEHSLPLTLHALRIMREEGVPMTVDEIVECLASRGREPTGSGSRRRLISSSGRR